MQTDNNETIDIGTHTLKPHAWVANYGDYLYTYAVTRINDEETARDLVQETFLAALVRAEKFEGRSSERTWLMAILKNKIIDVYRKKSSGLLKRTEALHEENGPEDFFEEENGSWKPRYVPKPFGIESYDPMVGKEFNHILRKCMQKLPALWLSVFTMKHMDDLDTEIICNELNVSHSNFWVIIHRTKINLRDCLQKNWV